MPRIAMIVGAALVAVGLVGYVAAQFSSLTALIPALLGVLLVALGWLAEIRPGARQHFMHAAAALALVGLLATARGLLKLPTLLGGGELERPAAVVSQSVMALVCLVFVVLCVQSFVQARRASRGGQSA